MKYFVHRLELQPVKTVTTTANCYVDGSNQSIVNSRLHQLWQGLLTVLHQTMQQRQQQTDKLEVWYSADLCGELWWSAYNPRTGRSLYQVPEVEIRRWIEKELKS